MIDLTALGNKDSCGYTYDAAAEAEQNLIGRRIAEGRKFLGLSLTEFQSLLRDYGVEVGTSGISKWEHGRSIPNSYQLIAIAHALHVDTDLSFFTGSCTQDQLNQKGILKLQEYRQDLIASGRYRKAPVQPRYREMPVSSLAASAGTGQFLDEENFELVAFPETSIPAGAEFGIRVSGDSMEPVYHDGQIVWVETCDQLHVNEVGIFVYDGEGFIKVYSEQRPDDSEAEIFTDSYGVLHMQPVLVSYNANYEPRVVSPHTNFQIIGRVL